jgi:hypothetical protein
VKGSEPGDQKMTGRPSSPGPDLQSPPAGEKPRAGIQDRRLVPVDETDLGVSTIDIPGVIDFLAEIRPGDRNESRRGTLRLSET